MSVQDRVNNFPFAALDAEALSGKRAGMVPKIILTEDMSEELNQMQQIELNDNRCGLFS